MADNENPPASGGNENPPASGNENPPASGGAPGKTDPYAALRGRTLTPEEGADLLAKLSAANSEAATSRHRLKTLERAAESATEKTVREAKEAGAKEAEAVWRPRVVNAAARAALTAAGAPAKGVDSLVRMLDLSSVEITEDGEVTGVKEAVKAVKDTFPALFAAGPPGTQSVRGTTLNGTAGGSARRTTPGDRVLAALTGQGS